MENFPKPKKPMSDLRRGLTLACFDGELGVLPLLNFIHRLEAAEEIFAYLIKIRLTGKTLLDHWESKKRSKIAVIGPILTKLSKQNRKGLFIQDFRKE